MESATASSSARGAPPPRLMLATAGCAGLVVRGDPVDAGDDPRGRAGAAAVEHADADQVTPLATPYVAPPTVPDDVRAVPVAVVGRAAADRVVARRRAAAEVGVA